MNSLQDEPAASHFQAAEPHRVVNRAVSRENQNQLLESPRRRQRIYSALGEIPASSCEKVGFSFRQHTRISDENVRPMTGVVHNVIISSFVYSFIAHFPLATAVLAAPNAGRAIKLKCDQCSVGCPTCETTKGSCRTGCSCRSAADERNCTGPDAPRQCKLCSK